MKAKQLFALLLALAMVTVLAACGEKAPQSSSTPADEGDSSFIAPADEGDSETTEPEAGPVQAGQYTYVEGDTTWVIDLREDGTCTVSETSTSTGEVVIAHVARVSTASNGWVDKGNGIFETNEWEPEERESNKVALASPNGVTCWKVVGEGLCEPTEKVEEFSYGAYHYYDEASDTYWSVMIMGNGSATIQYNDSEWNLLREDKEGNPLTDAMIDHTAEGFVVNEDGTFTTLATKNQDNVPEFLQPGDGTATWRIVGDGNVELVK